MTINVREFQKKLKDVCTALNIDDLSMVEITIPELKIYAITDSGEINFQMNNLKLSLDEKKSKKKKASAVTTAEEKKKVEKPVDRPVKKKTVRADSYSADELNTPYLSLRKEDIDFDKSATLTEIYLVRYSIHEMTGISLMKLFGCSESGVFYSAQRYRQYLTRYISRYYKSAIVDGEITISPIQDFLLEYYDSEFNLDQLSAFIRRCNDEIKAQRITI